MMTLAVELELPMASNVLVTEDSLNGVHSHFVADVS